MASKHKMGKGWHYVKGGLDSFPESKTSEGCIMLTLFRWAEKNAPELDIQQLYVDAYKNHDGGQTTIESHKEHEKRWAKHTIDEEYNWDDIDKITDDFEDVNYHMFNSILMDEVKRLKVEKALEA